MMSSDRDGDEPVLLAWNDLVGLTRGRGIPARELPRRLKSGINWACAGQALTPFDDIADNPWGPMNEVHMTPDPATGVRVALDGGGPPLAFYLCDGLLPDGSTWDCCTRGFLRAALADLEVETGLRVVAATELEFALAGMDLSGCPPFSLQAFRAAPEFGQAVLAALRQAGAAPETYEPEYGVGQFEIACAPAPGLAAADRIVVMREVIRDTARRLGLSASLSPMVAEGVPGNGAHLHLSLTDREGSPVTYDPDGHGLLSARAAAFAAGIVRHTPALCAITAPSPVSYFRLGPHHWSSGYACLGPSNREASLRIMIPRSHDAAALRTGLHLEFRPMDSTASPYLALGMLVRAGLQGLREGLSPPPLVEMEPDDVPEAEREGRGIRRLPGDLPAALQALQDDAIARGWLPERLLEVFLSIKRKELAMNAELGTEALLARYRDAY